jgi:hypothetical protein
MLWNQEVHTDRVVTANRPDIVIRIKEEKICIPTDVATPADRNVTQKGVERKLEHRSLCVEIQQVWNMKCVIIAVITGAT